MMFRHLVIVLTAILVFVWPTVAHAHLVNTGIGPFYNGLFHPFVNALDLLAILALSLLAGFVGPGGGRFAALGVTAGWSSGMVLGLVMSNSIEQTVLYSAGSVLVLSVLAACRIQFGKWILLPVSVCLGIWFGWVNGSEFRELPQARLASLGIATTVFVLATITAALTVKHDQGWTRIALRVVGSWIAAASLLTIGWELKTVLT